MSLCAARAFIDGSGCITRHRLHPSTKEVVSIIGRSYLTLQSDMSAYLRSSFSAQMAVSWPVLAMLDNGTNQGTVALCSAKAHLRLAGTSVMGATRDREDAMNACWKVGFVFCCVLAAGPALAQQALVIKPLAEKKISKLPEGKLFWRIETFGTEEQAKAAAGSTALVAQTAGKVWLFTLGPAGGVFAGTKVAEIGPLPDVVAAEYLLRINEALGAKGSVTPVHSHPGSETFFVIKGETSQKTPAGVHQVKAGTSMVGHGSDTPMQVSSTGADDLHSLVMFVVDATKPFSSPAKME
jgi:hypothetical protein